MSCSPVVWLELGISSALIDTGWAHLVMCILVAWSSLGALRSAVLSDFELSFLVCFGSTVLGLFDFLVWFVSGVSLSRVPVGLESADVCDSITSAVCVLVREEVCVTARFGM